MWVINEPLKKLHIAARAHKLDYIGAVLVVVATGLLLLALNWGGVEYAWASPQVLGLAVVSIVLFVACGIRLTRAAEPLVSLEVLSNKIVLAGSFAMFMVAAANVGLAVYLPVYAQAYLGLSPAGSGYALLGFLLGTTVGAATSGRLTMRVVHVKRLAIGGSLVAAAAFIVLGLLASQTSILVLEVVLIILGLGLGATFPVTTVSVQNGVDQQHLGVATGMLTFLRSRCSALGVAVLGAIALGYGVPLGAEGGAGQVQHVADAFPFALLYYAMAAMMLAAAVINALMPHKALRGSNERAAPAMAE